MDDEFSSSLREELSRLSEPPIGDLVGQAARQGRRIRRFRTIGATAAVAAVATVTALFSGQLVGSGHTGAQGIGPAAPVGASVSASPNTSATPSAAPSTTPGASAAPSAGATPDAGSASPTPGGGQGSSAPAGVPASTPAAAGSDALVKSTPASLLAAVVQSLPSGITTDHYYGDAPQPPITLDPSVNLYLHSGGKTGRIGVSAYKADTPSSCTTPEGETGVSATCSTDAAGEFVNVLSNPSNCIQNTTVTVYRHDGIAVSVDLSTCLDNSARGTSTPLTQAQAVTLADSTLLNVVMPSSFVKAADTQYAGSIKVSP
ncbi:hypothetical protein [Kitasatospora viridis]|uniref:Uncharacterized protein n=1 Tax=Kitasatospora viridis TaxID=281105 RepID=A0A561UDN8_9ACTN|nr:hypothetical protein [Kitasatospora viridis]TWF97448.1 hypothetical protein FHX73_111228 [Kitasatospora viridis]